MHGLYHTKKRNYTPMKAFCTYKKMDDSCRPFSAFLYDIVALFYAQNSGNSSSLPTFSIRSNRTNTTVGRTMRLPFLMARPAPM